MTTNNYELALKKVAIYEQVKADLAGVNAISFYEMKLMDNSVAIEVPPSHLDYIGESINDNLSMIIHDAVQMAKKDAKDAVRLAKAQAREIVEMEEPE
jgi:hypothetical protein